MSEALYTARGNFLERWYDGSMELPPDIDDRRITHDEIERLSILLATTIYATSLPRRLGGDAGKTELALDKKRGRRCSFALNQSLKGWGGRNLVNIPEPVRRAGAQLDWEQFKVDHSTAVTRRAVLVATWAVRTQNRRWGRTAIVRFTNELKWVEYALRD